MHREHVILHAGRYLWTWIGLVAFALLSFGLSYVHTGAWEMPIALLIAAAKAALVLLFFMHLVEVKPIHAFVLVVAGSLLSLLLLLVGADVASRHTFPPAPLLEAPRRPLELRPPPPGGGANPSVP